MTTMGRRLPAISLFQNLTDVQLQYILSNSRERTFRAGTSIMHQEEQGETFYIILEGTVKVSLTLPDGSEVYLAVLATGDTMGEMSLIDASGRSADVTAQETTRVLMLNRKVFDQLLTEGTIFTRNLMRILSRRLRLANVRIQAHCTLDTYGMVAYQILEFADLYGISQGSSTYIPIRLTQSDLATLVGASRERVNQVMVAYRKSSHISVDSRYHITVLNRDALEKRVRQS